MYMYMCMYMYMYMYMHAACMYMLMLLSMPHRHMYHTANSSNILHLTQPRDKSIQPPNQFHQKSARVRQFCR